MGELRRCNITDPLHIGDPSWPDAWRCSYPAGHIADAARGPDWHSWDACPAYILAFDEDDDGDDPYTKIMCDKRAMHEGPHHVETEWR